SELDSLRQENARLIAKISGIESEKLEMKWIFEARTDKLHNTIAEFTTKIGKLNAEIVELKKNNTLSNMSEQKVSEEISNCLLKQTLIPDVPPTNKLESIIAQPEQYNPNVEDTFLDEVYKKSVSDEIKEEDEKQPKGASHVTEISANIDQLK
ncbi:1529_t:CDS:2, partial [Funneliformis mosseae]